VHYATRVFQIAMLPLLIALANGLSFQQKPDAPSQKAAVSANPCEVDGVILCYFDQIETVSSPRSLEDMRIIGKYLQLVSERNRRYYLSWRTQSPSAAFELVKRIKPFPYLPVEGDTYSITGISIALNQTTDRITVRYPKKLQKSMTAPIRDGDLVSYDTKLSTFINALEKEIAKLKKYEK